MLEKNSRISQICLEFVPSHSPPSYEQEIWHYEKANVDQIRRSVDEFSWKRCFANTSVNDKVHMFNKTTKNVMPN